MPFSSDDVFVGLYLYSPHIMTIITIYIAIGMPSASAPDTKVALYFADIYPLSRPQRRARIRSIPLAASLTYAAEYGIPLKSGASSITIPNMSVIE